jgi:hypothetical protein
VFVKPSLTDISNGGCWRHRAEEIILKVPNMRVNKTAEMGAL